MSDQQQKELIGVERAEHIVQDRMPALAVESIALSEAVGRILAEDIVADRPHPPFDRVMMDGVALRFGDWQAGQRRFAINGVQAAGQQALSLEESGGCIEVMTGAPLPSGCDCVVPVEDLTSDGSVITLNDNARIRAGGYVHRAGSDRAAGDPLLARGIIIDSPAIAVLATEGCDPVRVAARPSICVVATGDELVSDQQALETFQIRSSNAPAIAAMLRQHGWGDAAIQHLPDDRTQLASGLASALQAHDIVVLSGGVSKGRFDFVPEVLDAAGFRMRFHGVRQRPGKPFWFGTRSDDGKAVFALPGNPVSALVCARRYLLPALLQAGGHSPVVRRVRLGSALEFIPDLRWFLPVKLVNDDDENLLAMPQVSNTSGDLASLAHTDGFIELPAAHRQFPAGFAASFFAWSP